MIRNLFKKSQLLRVFDPFSSNNRNGKEEFWWTFPILGISCFLFIFLYKWHNLAPSPRNNR